MTEFGEEGWINPFYEKGEEKKQKKDIKMLYKKKKKILKQYKKSHIDIISTFSDMN